MCTVTPDQRQENDDDRQGYGHPVQESDLRIIGKTVFVKSGKNDIGRSADQRTYPAYARRIRQAQHEHRANDQRHQGPRQDEGEPEILGSSGRDV